MRLLYLFALAAPAFAASDLAVYTLLSPPTHSFELAYDTLLARAGAIYFFNPISPGSVASKAAAIDLASGQALELKSVSGREAKAANAAPANTADNAQFLRVKLRRPVAQGAETRIRILQTFVDAASYHATGTGFVFERPSVVTRNVAVLPAGWRAKGATLSEIMKATEWQAHSVRGFISTAGNKGAKIESSKNETGERVYRAIS